MPQAIILQFATETSLGSGLIRFYGHGWCSHVDAVLPDGRLLGARNDVLMGVPAGVQIRPPGYAPFTHTQRVTLMAPDPIVDDFYAFVQSQVGKPYDDLAILAFAVDRDWRNAGAWFCSELDGRGLEVAGYFPAPLATHANKLTPPDLLLACSARVPVPVV